MRIQVVCDECFTSMAVGSEHAGKLAKCKSCGAKVRIPSEIEDPPPVELMRSPSLKQQTPSRRPAKPKSASKKKTSRKPKSEGTSTGAKSAVVTAIVVIAVGLRSAGRISRYWHDYQQRQQQQGAQAMVDSGASASPPSGSPLAVASSSDPHALYSLTTSSIEPPAFNESTFREVPVAGGKGYIQSVPTQGASPNTLMALGVYLPAGNHQPGSLPCVLFAPAGTPLIHGNALDGNPNNPEFAPYLRAGYAVVEFSLDGWYDSNQPSDAALAMAYRQFSAAGAGVRNADAAFRFAQNNLPLVDPKQIYIAGHSSAGTLALLYAAHQPQLAGCLAYAPQVDVVGHLQKAFSTLDEEKVFPGIGAFVKQSSPLSHVDQIRVPVMAFHATGDDVTSAARTRQFCDQLKQAGGDVTFIEVPGNDHYQTMISPGLKKGVNWLASRVRPSSGADVASTSVAAGPSQGMRPAEGASPFKPRPPGDSAAPGPGQALPPALVEEMMRKQSRIVAPAPNTEPPQTRKVDVQTSMEVGTRVLAARGHLWMAAEVVENMPDERVKVHYLQLPAAFDTDLPWSHVRLPIPVNQIAKDDLETVRFNLILVPQGGAAAAKSAAEPELLAIEGYIPGSLEVDVRNRRVSVKVVRGSAAEKDSLFALTRAQLAVTKFTSSRRN